MKRRGGRCHKLRYTIQKKIDAKKFNIDINTWEMPPSDGAKWRTLINMKQKLRKITDGQNGKRARETKRERSPLDEQS